MLLNIISRQVHKDRITGPKKVLSNACEGLKKIGVEYVFNEPIAKHICNWIHDDPIAIVEASLLHKPVVIGPNTAVLPKDLPTLRPRLHPASAYLHPSQWCVEVWKYLEWNECKLYAWPVGINTNSINARELKNVNLKKVMLYFKQRDKSLLTKAKQLLKDAGFEVSIIQYGYYDQKDYLQTLSESAFGVWIGCSESQGIALQEALASGMPLIVLDATSVFDTVSEGKKGYFDYQFPKKLHLLRSTSSPYFDERCGIVIENIEKLPEAIEEMGIKLHQFNPRAYIKENLGLDVCAQKLVSFFDEIDLMSDNGSSLIKPISIPIYYVDLVTKRWFYKWIWQKTRSRVWSVAR